MKTVGIIGDVFKNLLNSDIFNSNPTAKINNLTTAIDLITTYLGENKFKHLRKRAKRLRKILKHFGNGVKALIDSGMLKNNDETFKIIRKVFFLQTKKCRLKQQLTVLIQ